MSEPTREDVIDVLAMSPMTDQMGTSMVPIRQTADAVLALFAPALAAARREGQAEAWDEGHDAATDEAPDGVWPDAWIDAPNPYRKEAER